MLDTGIAAAGQLLCDLFGIAHIHLAAVCLDENRGHEGIVTSTALLKFNAFLAAAGGRDEKSMQGEGERDEIEKAFVVIDDKNSGAWVLCGLGGGFGVTVSEVLRNVIENGFGVL